MTDWQIVSGLTSNRTVVGDWFSRIFHKDPDPANTIQFQYHVNEEYPFVLDATTTTTILSSTTL